MALNAVGSRLRRLSVALGMRSAAVAPLSAPPPQDLHVGKKLANEFWLPGLQAATVDINSDQLKAKARQASSAFGGEVHLLATHNSTYTGPEAHLVGLSKSGVLIGVYEVSDYSCGVLFKRVCDHPVQELVRLGKFPAEWPRKYEPVNTRGGSRKLPSRISAKDLLEG